MKELLFLTDFSENAKKAMYYGLFLYSGMPYKFNIVHAVYLPYSRTNESAAETDIRTEEARASFQRMLKDIDADFPENKFDITTDIVSGEVVDVTAHLVKQKEIELIIMGTHGISGLVEIFMGSNTVDVIRKVDCAVLAIPLNHEFKIPKKALVAIDEDKRLMELVLKPMINIASKHNVEVVVLHVSEKLKESSQYFVNTKRYFEDLNASFVTIFDDDVAKALDGFSRANKVDMLGIINRKLGFFERLFHRSLSRTMALNADIPLLIMSDNN